MLLDPLHPAIVHFPVVLAFLLPLLASAALWAIRRGARSRRAWSVPLVAALALAVSAWIAVETGEAQEERVERVVGEQRLSRHAEMAEAFLAGSAGLAFVAVTGLLGGLPGRISRVVTTVGSVGLVAGATLVGHSGGELVYRYGAASAYSRESVGGSATSSIERSARSRTANDDERH